MKIFVLKSHKLVKKGHEAVSFCYKNSLPGDKKVTNMNFFVIKRHYLMKKMSNCRFFIIFYNNFQIFLYTAMLHCILFQFVFRLLMVFSYSFQLQVLILSSFKEVAFILLVYLFFLLYSFTFC